MSTGTTPAIQGATKRSVPRYKLTVPAEVTVLRSGIPENVPGRTVELGEGGIGVVVASRLLLGESVRVEFLLPHTTTPVRATAVVRYQRELCCGLQFVRLPAEQQSTIRYWTRCEANLSFSGKDSQPDKPAASSPLEDISDVSSRASAQARVEGPRVLLKTDDRVPKPANWSRWIAVTAFTVAVTASLQWWHWQQEWAELEAQVPERQTISNPQLLKIPGDIMQQRLRHKVAPDYPPDARRAGVQGTVLLHGIVSATGTVTELDYLSGPQALSRAALDAVRWWRYEPYLLNNQPVTVETTIAVSFRLAN